MRSAFTLLLALVVASVPVCVEAEITGPLAELEHCAKLISDNAAALKTWSGQAEIVDETTKDDATTKRTTTVDFLYKADGHQVRYSSTQVAVHKGVEKARVFERGVKSRTEFCSHLPFMLSGPGRPARFNQLDRQPADSFKSQAGVFSTVFDPTVFAEVSPRGNAEELRYFRENAHLAMGAGSVTVSDNLVRLVMGADGKGPHLNHTFDKSQAGLPTHFGKRDQITDVTYEVVDGVYLPSTVTIRRTTPRLGVTNLNVRFSGSKVNAPVDDAEFDVAKLPEPPRS